MHILAAAPARRRPCGSRRWRVHPGLRSPDTSSPSSSSRESPVPDVGRPASSLMKVRDALACGLHANSPVVAFKGVTPEAEGVVVAPPPMAVIHPVSMTRELADELCTSSPSGVSHPRRPWWRSGEHDGRARRRSMICAGADEPGDGLRSAWHRGICRRAAHG